ncbi:MAG: FAD-dependent monooxygenase, partial [Caulobacteraceae bacterium]|nr:FAD-dependent monooxygenase [Caulobacteraceae bacterium]
MQRVAVVIVGGSLNGFIAAVLLSQLGGRCLVVERNPATTVQYKFAGISPRSMEIYRGVGLEDAIRAHRRGDQKSGQIARARNLSDPAVEFLGKPWSDTDDLSAATAETCHQNR